MRSTLCLAVLLTAAVSAQPPSFAQHIPLPGSGAQVTTSATLTNSDVIAMSEAGLDDSIIVDKIHNTPSHNFDTSVEGLKSLRAGKVSNSVIREMMSNAIALEVAANSNDPSVIHPPGVYLMIFSHDGSTHMTMLEHTRAMGDKTSGNSMAMAYGFGKMHTKQSLNGPHSPVQLDDANPTFYIYIPEDTQSFGGSDLSARDFELIRLKEKDAVREVETASMGRTGMGTTGVQDKTRQLTVVNRLKPGVYMVKMGKPLKPGEYAFEHQLDGIYYDFGIREAK